MNGISERLNEEYFGYIIEIAFYNKKFDFDKLKRYLTTKSGEYIYVITGNGILTALVDIPETKNVLRNKIVNYLSNVEKRPKKMYEIQLIEYDDWEHDKKFDVWLSQSIYRIEKRGKKWDYKFYMTIPDDDFTNKIYSTQYIDYFRSSKTHADIQANFQMKREKRRHTEKMKLIKEEIDKKLFMKKINAGFRFTENKGDYLSKRVVCDLLDLDYKSKGDIKRLNIILTDYGVRYDKLKMIKGDRGVFFNIIFK